MTNTIRLLFGRAVGHISEQPLIALLVASILFSGPMVFGYAVFDELVVYAILIFVIGTSWNTLRQNESSRFETFHRWLFITFAGYLVLESIRGMVALGDIRVARFLALFVVLILIARFIPGIRGDQSSLLTLSRVVAFAGSVYFIIYFLVGVLAENFFGMHRSDFQGLFWSGTTTAIFPIYVMLPALALLVANTNRQNRLLFWLSYIALILVCSYYDSRSMKLALLAFLLLGCFKAGTWRFIPICFIYLTFIIYFPWAAEEKLTFENLRSYVVTSPQSVNTKMFVQRSWLFGEALVPGLLPILRQRIAPELNPESKENTDFLMHQAYRSYDFDRKTAIVAATRYIINGDFIHKTFGGGFYTHRYALIQPFQEVAKENNYSFPERYATTVRTATFNGMLADTGILGILLLGTLVMISAVTIATSGNKGKLLSLASLGLILISMVASAQYDLVLFYLVFLPRGPLLAFHSANKSTSEVHA